MPHPTSMKTTTLQLWIAGLLGVAALAALSASASAAPISSITGIARNDGIPVTKVAKRQRQGSQAHKARQSRRYYGAAGVDNSPPASDWQDLDSNDLPFGSPQWWRQHPS